MEMKFRLHADRSRFSMAIHCEGFDGRPGLQELWFDGINEEVAPDVAGLAAWILCAPFVSQRMRFSRPLSRPLQEKMMSLWNAPLEIGPVDDQPARFPPRAGTLYLLPDGAPDWPGDIERSEQPVYRLRQLPLNANGTSYAGENVGARTNVTLLGQGLLAPGFAQQIAPALVYADFLGIANIVVQRDAVDAPPPMKKRYDIDTFDAWRELLKSAGFNLWFRA